MKRAFTAILSGVFILSISAMAWGHCGGCGVGGEKKLEKSCAQQCTGKKDKAACITKCETEHKKKKHPKK